MLLVFLYTVHVIISVLLILVILLQQGSGADLSVFGGGGTQTSFGARGATQLIHRLTVWGFVGFILVTLSIALVQGTAGGASVMRGISEAAPDVGQPAGEEVEAEPGAELPPVAPPQE